MGPVTVLVTMLLLVVAMWRTVAVVCSRCGYSLYRSPSLSRLVGGSPVGDAKHVDNVQLAIFRRRRGPEVGQVSGRPAGGGGGDAAAAAAAGCVAVVLAYLKMLLVKERKT